MIKIIALNNNSKLSAIIFYGLILFDFSILLVCQSSHANYNASDADELNAIVNVGIDNRSARYRQASHAVKFYNDRYKVFTYLIR